MKKTIFILLILAGTMGTGLFYYLFSNDAPITHGEIQFNVPYKEGHTLDIHWTSTSQRISK